MQVVRQYHDSFHPEWVRFVGHAESSSYSLNIFGQPLILALRECLREKVVSSFQLVIRHV